MSDPRPELVPWTTHPEVVQRPGPTPAQQVKSWLWALVPFFTIGIGNAPVFLYAAIRKGSRSWWWTFAGYGAALAVMLSLSGSAEGSAAEVVSSVVIVSNFLVGSVHALAVRSRVWQPAAVLDLRGEPVLARAIEAEGRRELAMRILAQDPQLASDLAIGRPDLGRGYDDGGLVDVNTAPPEVIMAITGVPQADLAKIMRARDAAGGFTSIEELAVLADLAPSLVDGLRDRLVFSPR